LPSRRPTIWFFWAELNPTATLSIFCTATDVPSRKAEC
jgi:hypothetical protein